MKKKLFITLATLVTLVGCGGESTEVHFDLRDPIRVESRASLPAEIAADVAYPIEYVFRNVDIRRADGLTFSNDFPPQFTITQDNCSSRTFLDPRATCTISGMFEATSPGSYQMGSKVSYDGGRTLNWTVKTTVVEVRVLATEIVALPANIEINTGYNVEVLFRNVGTQPAQVEGFTLTSTNNFLSITADECSGITILGGGQSCTIKGIAEAPSAGDYQYTLNFVYNGGKSSSFTRQTTATQVAIQGEVIKPLPVHTAIGETYEVEFQFTNTSFGANASGIKFSSNYPLGFTQTMNTCGNSLDSLASCTITGRFAPSLDNNVDINVTADYGQGSPVRLSTTSQVTRFNEFNYTLNASHLDSPLELFKFSDLTKKTSSAGLPGFNAFLILPSVQEYLVPPFVSPQSYLSESIYNGEIRDTPVAFSTDTGNQLTLLFRANRPLCITTFGAEANRQLNDRTSCEVDLSERVVTVQIERSSYNLLPAGSHRMTLRLSNQYHFGNIQGAGEYSNLAIVNFIVLKN